MGAAVGFFTLEQVSIHTHGKHVITTKIVHPQTIRLRGCTMRTERSVTTLGTCIDCVSSGNYTT